MEYWTIIVNLTTHNVGIEFTTASGIPCHEGSLYSQHQAILQSRELECASSLQSSQLVGDKTRDYLGVTSDSSSKTIELQNNIQSVSIWNSQRTVDKMVQKSQITMKNEFHATLYLRLKLKHKKDISKITIFPKRIALILKHMAVCQKLLHTL